jgi:heme/copper-type cytochrome/quinol oxidase subunit 4
MWMVVFLAVVSPPLLLVRWAWMKVCKTEPTDVQIYSTIVVAVLAVICVTGWLWAPG